MSQVQSDNFLFKNPKPAQEYERKPLSATVYTDWGSTGEVDIFFATAPLDPTYKNNKYFWIAGYYYFFDGTSYLPITLAPVLTAVQGIAYRVLITGPTVTISQLIGMRLLTCLYANITYDADTIILNPVTGVVDGTLVGGFEAGYLLTIMYQAL